MTNLKTGDTRIDILDLMSEQDVAINSEPFKDLGFELEDHTGLLALKFEAEKAFLELSTTDFEQPEVRVVQQLPPQGSDNVYDQGLGLLELLTADISQQQQVLGISDFAGLDLAPGVDTSGPILSPMSPEDVESILSSGPPSPQSHIAEESFESLMSSMMGSDISFNDSSVKEEITSYEEAPNPIDLVLLSQMMSSGNNNTTAMDITSDSDSDYQPEESSPPSGRGARIKVKKEASEDALGKVKDRKLRKKQQNKDAATRYRQKKKFEQDIINDEVAQLEGRNNELKDKVDHMSKEIAYLKSLLTDVYKARTKTSKKSKWRQYDQ